MVAVARGSSLILGHRVALTSLSEFTALGIDHAVVLRTLLLGAQLIIGKDVGISGGTIVRRYRFSPIGFRPLSVTASAEGAWSAAGCRGGEPVGDSRFQGRRRTVEVEFREESMSRNAVKRLYLMQVGSMPQYQIPIVCYLVQTEDGRNILIDSGLPEVIPEDAPDFENGQDVTLQLASIGLTPDAIDTVISTHYDIDHAGRHAAFTEATYVVQRVHHLDAASNPRFAATRPQWDQPMERLRLVDGDTELLPGLELIETGGHVPGHQSVLVRLPTTGPVLLTADAVPFRDGWTRDEPEGGSQSHPDAEAIRASTIKLLDLAEREQIGLVIFGHEQAQWEGLKQLPDSYE